MSVMVNGGGKPKEEILSIEKGGTNADTTTQARKNLGFTYSDTVPTTAPDTGEGSVCFVLGDGSPTPIEEGGTNAVTAQEAVENLGIADYVVEYGVNGVWTYEKWNSGKAVCRCSDTKSVACTTTYGNLYGGSTAISLPSDLFVSVDNIKVVTGGSTGSGYAFFGRYASVTTSEFSALFFSTASASKSISFSAEIVGTWK